MAWFLSWSQTLRMRIMGLVAVSVLTPTILTGWMANVLLNRDLRRELFSNNKIRNEQLAGRVSDWFKELFDQVKAFATSSYLFSEQVERLADGSKKEDVVDAQADVDRYLTYLVQDNPYFEGFAILSDQGAPLSAYPSDIVPWLTGLVSGKSDAESALREVNTGSGTKIFLLQMVGGSQREKPVYLAGLIKTGALALVMSQDLAEDGLAYLVDAQGNIKEHTSTAALEATLPPAANPIFRQGTEAIVYRGIRGSDVIGSASKIAATDWWLVSETPGGQAFANMAKFRSYIVYMTLIIAGLLLFPALLVARTIVLPLEELSRAAKRIHDGELGTEVQTKPIGELGEFIQVFNAMSQGLMAMTQQLKVMSITDPLTGRANRRFMEDQLARSAKLAQRTSAHLSVVMVDLDHFKRYNDTHGHLAGDEALKQVGDLLVGSVRETDFVSRFGGEEFLISLEGASKENAGRVAEKIRASVEGHVFRWEKAATRITASLGVATYPEDGKTITDLIGAADRALYKAKKLGRNRVQPADSQEGSASA